MKILIVDDDQGILEILETFFTNLGHSVVKADDGSKGIKQVAISNPDLVFLDIRLPDMNGIAVLKEIKEINKDLVVIIITGYKEAEKVIEAFRYGAVDCLLKPLNFDYLKNLLPQLKTKKGKK